MKSIISVPFRLVWGITGTLLKIVGLVLNFGLKSIRFAGGRFFSVIAAALIGFFLGKKYFAGKEEENK